MRFATCLILLMLLNMLAGPAPPQALSADYRIELADYLSHRWQKELVTYPFSADNGNCVVGSVGLRGPKGPVPVPVQLVDVIYWPETQFVKSARLAFVVDELAPLASHSYTVSFGPKETETPQPAGDLKIELTPTQCEATTSRFGVRLLLGEKTYDEPVDPDSVPGPIEGMRLADGTWFGGSRLFSDWRAIAGDANQSPEGKAVAQRWADDWSRIGGYSARVVAAGPALARVVCEYRMVDGETRTVIVQLAAGGDRITITSETTRRPEPDQGLNPVMKDGWELLLHGLPPLALQFRPQQGRQQEGSVVLPSGWEEREIATHPARPFGIDWAAPSTRTADRIVTTLTPWGMWVDEYEQTDLYLAFLDTRKPGTDSTDARELAIHRLDAGLWVTPDTLESRTSSAAPLMKEADGSLALRLSDAARTRRLTVGENSSFLARANANRITDWGVMVMPELVERLDIVKDMVLSWPEQRKNPLLFLNAEQMQAAAQREPDAIKSLQDIDKLRQVLDQYEHGYSDTMRAALGAFCQYDALVNSEGLSAEERTVLRARTAYLAYRLASPANWSPKHGYASGNQNMTVAHMLNKGMAGCVMPDHPLAREWAAEPIEWMEGWMKTLDESGHWWESADYARVSTSKFMYFAIAMRNAGLHDFISDPRFKRMAAYYPRTTLTPPDPERIMSGAADPQHRPRVTVTYGRGGHANLWGLSGLLAPYYRESDPELSRELQWSYRQCRPTSAVQPTMGEPMMGYELLIPDLDLPSVRPDWRSELLPRVGALFRSGVGTPDENFLLFVMKYGTNPDGEIWPSEVGTLQLWYDHGQPLSRIFPSIPRGNIYHGLLCNRVMLASNSSPNTLAPAAGYIGKESREGAALLPRLDYLDSKFVWEQPWSGHSWAPPDSAPAFPAVPREGKLDSPVTWRRQVLYVRDDEPGGRNYLVVRDGVRGGQPTQWHFWTVSQGLSEAGQEPPAPPALDDQRSSANRELRGDRFTALGKYGRDVEYFVAAPSGTPRHTLRYRYDYPRSNVSEFKHEQDLLHLRLDGDGEYFVALFPRNRTETAPTFTTLGEGTVIKVKGKFGKDYNFLAGASHKTTAEDATFNGTAASVQDRETGLVLALADNGSVQYQAYGLAASLPANLRVAPELLTLTLMTEHPATEITIKAPKALRLAQETPGVALRETNGICRVTIPAEVTTVKLVQK